MKNENVYDRIRARVKPETRRYVRINMAIASRVTSLLKSKGWTQKDLAKATGKSASEISKWLSGTHNLTLKSIALLETALGADIFTVAAYADNAGTQVPNEAKLSLPQAS